MPTRTAPRLEDLPEALTEAEVLEVLPISRPTLRRLRESGTVRAVRAGRRVLYPRRAIIDYLDASA